MAKRTDTDLQLSMDNSQCSMSVLEAAGRSLAYSCLARGMAYPTPEWLQWLLDETCEAHTPLGRTLFQMREAARRAGLDGLCRSYMRVFDPRREPYPLEAEHQQETPDDEGGCAGAGGTGCKGVLPIGSANQRTAVLADVMAFYKAFGAVPYLERPDHICCELDFLHLVSLKEAMARLAGRHEDAQTCRQARRRFLADHLLGWYPAVIEQIRSRAERPGDEFYLELAEGLEQLMTREKGEAA